LNTKNASRFNRAKVLELKAKTDGIRKTKHKLFAVFDDTRDAETGYSLKEMVPVIRPEYTSKNGEPTLKGMISTKQAIREFRKTIIEKGEAAVVPFAVKTIEGWLYYNMQTRKQFQPTIKLGQNVIAGIERLLREMLRILETKRTEKNDVNDQMREDIRKSLLVLKKSRRLVTA